VKGFTVVKGITVVRGFICGEGIYPRWAAKRTPAFFQADLASRFSDGFAAERG
jgi:hypothetical protein